MNGRTFVCVWFRDPSMPALRYMEENGLAAMSAGVTPEVKLRKRVTLMPLSIVNKVAHSGLEIQRRRHQKSKTGVSVAPQKGLMSPSNFFKNLKITICSLEYKFSLCNK